VKSFELRSGHLRNAVPTCAAEAPNRTAAKCPRRAPGLLFSRGALAPANQGFCVSKVAPAASRVLQKVPNGAIRVGSAAGISPTSRTLERYIAAVTSRQPLKLFGRKAETSLPAALSNAVTCKNCLTEISIKVDISRLPEDFSVPCPLCGARKIFGRSDVHVRNKPKTTAGSIRD
jgi:hypothetical protein